MSYTRSFPHCLGTPVHIFVREWYDDNILEFMASDSSTPPTLHRLEASLRHG